MNNYGGNNSSGGSINPAMLSNPSGHNNQQRQFSGGNPGYNPSMYSQNPSQPGQGQGGMNSMGNMSGMGGSMGGMNNNMSAMNMSAMGSMNNMGGGQASNPNNAQMNYQRMLFSQQNSQAQTAAAGAGMGNSSGMGNMGANMNGMGGNMGINPAATFGDMSQNNQGQQGLAQQGNQGGGGMYGQQQPLQPQHSGNASMGMGGNMSMGGNMGMGGMGMNNSNGMPAPGMGGMSSMNNMGSGMGSMANNMANNLGGMNPTQTMSPQQWEMISRMTGYSVPQMLAMPPQQQNQLIQKARAFFAAQKQQQQNMGAQPGAMNGMPGAGAGSMGSMGMSNGMMGNMGMNNMNGIQNSNPMSGGPQSAAPDHSRPASAVSSSYSQHNQGQAGSPPNSAGVGGMGAPHSGGMGMNMQNGYGAQNGMNSMGLMGGMSGMNNQNPAQNGAMPPPAFPHVSRPPTAQAHSTPAANSPARTASAMSHHNVPATPTMPGSAPGSAQGGHPGQGQQHMMGGMQPPRMPTPSSNDIQRPPTATSMTRPGTGMSGASQPGQPGMGQPGSMGMPGGMGNMGMAGGPMQRPPSRITEMGGTPGSTPMANGMMGNMGMSPNPGMRSGSMGGGMPLPAAALGGPQHPALARPPMGGAPSGMGNSMNSSMGMDEPKDDVLIGLPPPSAAQANEPPALSRQSSIPAPAFSSPVSSTVAPAGTPMSHLPGAPGMPPASRDGSRAPQPAGPSTAPGAPPNGMPPALRQGPQLDARRTKVERGEPPALDDAEVADVRKWMDADDAYMSRRQASGARISREPIAPSDLRSGLGLNGPLTHAWYERNLAAGPPPHPKGPVAFRWQKSAKDREKERLAEKKRDIKRRETISVPAKILDKDAEKAEVLVPIRLEFDVEHQKMRDTFVWNLNDPVITPEMFAMTVVEDYNLPQSFHTTITKAIQDQLSDFQAHMTAPADVDKEKEKKEEVKKQDTAEPKQGTLSTEDIEWWATWRQAAADGARIARGASPHKRRKVATLDEEPLDLDGFEFDEGTAQDDLRIVIKLDVIVGSMKLDDQIEWDLENSDASPEAFAEVYAQDLGLTGEFKTAVIHQIREQIVAHQKTLFLSGGVAGFMADDDLRTSVLPVLQSGARSMDQVNGYTPQLTYVSESDIERSEREREKEIVRRRKRTNRARRGVAMPEREPQRTFRTPGIGFAPVDPANLTAQVMLNAPTSRRAAAVAAQNNIAHMVASENRPEDMDPLSSPIASLSAHPSNAANAKEAKEAKAKFKGLFVAPEYPPEVLRPRATAEKPTGAEVFERGYLLPETSVDQAVAPTMASRPPDSSRQSGAMLKRKDPSRAAKELEYMEGMHPNMIDGEWHCSNCGIPASIAEGRRKGPMGEKTQCGTCGKYWHRYRKPRPCEYHADLEYHQNHINELNRAKQASQASRRKGRPPANPQPMERAASERSDSPVKREAWVEIPARRNNSSRSITRVQSPVTSDDSDDEAPLAAKRRTNGSAAASTPGEDGSVGPQALLPPAWMTACMADINARYPDDRVEITLKNPKSPATAIPEWRLKCLDCPGRLYNHGPGESLSNFEVHVKNRIHRQRVLDRTELEL